MCLESLKMCLNFEEIVLILLTNSYCLCKNLVSLQHNDYINYILQAFNFQKIKKSSIAPKKLERVCFTEDATVAFTELTLS